MDGHINVAIRIRPLNQRELSSASSAALIQKPWHVQGDTIIQRIYTESRVLTGNTFTFDKVFDQNTTTPEVYDQSVSGIISSSMEGINGTIFAYGQTSSGKTYTMHGTNTDPGIIKLAVRNMFDIIEKTKNREFLIRVSYLEIYNEVIRDLLDPTKTNLKIHETVKREIFVGGLSEQIVFSAKEVEQLLERGDRNRHIGGTNMNERSSRSHTIFRIIIESRERLEPGDDDDKDSQMMGSSFADDENGGFTGAVKVSCLNLVDLAGSERVGQTGAEGQRLKEGAHINKSLLALGTVISRLSEEGGDCGHVPYRDSKLTRILQTSLGGNARTAIICTITPAAAYSDETLSTLKFASRAKTITNTPEINEELRGDALLRRLKRAKELEDEVGRMRSIAEMKIQVEERNKSLLKNLWKSEQERLRLERELEDRKNLIFFGHMRADASASAPSDETGGREIRRQTWFPGIQTSGQPVRSALRTGVAEQGLVAPAIPENHADSRKQKGRLSNVTLRDSTQPMDDEFELDRIVADKQHISFLEDQLEKLRGESDEQQKALVRFVDEYTGLLCVLNELAEAEVVPATPPKAASASSHGRDSDGGPAHLPEITKLRRRLRYMLHSLDAKREQIDNMRRERPEAQFLELELEAARQASQEFEATLRQKTQKTRELESTLSSAYAEVKELREALARKDEEAVALANDAKALTARLMEQQKVHEADRDATAQQVATLRSKVEEVNGREQVWVKKNEELESIYRTRIEELQVQLRSAQSEHEEERLRTEQLLRELQAQNSALQQQHASKVEQLEELSARHAADMAEKDSKVGELNATVDALKTTIVGLESKCSADAVENRDHIVRIEAQLTEQTQQAERAKSAERRCNELEIKLAELEEHQKSVDQNMELLKTRACELEEDNRQLTIQAEKLRSDIEDREAQAEELESKRSEAEKVARELRNELDQLVSIKELESQQVSEWKHRSQDQEQILSQRDESIQTLRDELGRTKGALDANQKQIEDLSKRLGQEVARAADAQKEKDETIKQANERLEELDFKTQALEQQLHTEKDRHAEADAEVERLREAGLRLAGETENLASEVERQREARKSAEVRASALEAQLRDAQEGSEHQRDLFGEELAQLEQKRAEAAEKLEAVERDATALAENLRLTQDKHEAAQRVAEARERELDGEVKSLKTNCESLQKELEAATSELVEAKKSVEEAFLKRDNAVLAMEKILSERAEETAALQSQLSQLQTQLAGALSKNEELTDELVSVKIQLEAKENEVLCAKESLQRSSSTSDALQSRLREMEDELTTLHSECNELKAQKDAVEGQLVTLSQKLTALSETNSSLSSDLNATKKELESVTAFASTLKGSNAALESQVGDLTRRLELTQSESFKGSAELAEQISALQSQLSKQQCLAEETTGELLRAREREAAKDLEIERLTGTKKSLEAEAEQLCQGIQENIAVLTSSLDELAAYIDTVVQSSILPDDWRTSSPHYANISKVVNKLDREMHGLCSSKESPDMQGEAISGLQKHILGFALNSVGRLVCAVQSFEDVNTRLDETEARLEVTVKELDEANRSIEMAKSMMAELARIKDEEIGRLEEEVTRLSDQAESLRQEHETKEARISELALECAESRRRLEEESNEHASLCAQFEELKSQTSAQKCRIKDLEVRAEETERLKSELAVIQDNLDSKDRELSACREQLQRLEEQAEDLEETKRRVEADVQALRDENFKLRTDISKLQAGAEDIGVLQEAFNHLQARVVALVADEDGQSRCDGGCEQIASDRPDSGRLEAIIDDTILRIKGYRGAEERYKSDIQRLQSDVDGLTKANAKLERRIVKFKEVYLNDMEAIRKEESMARDQIRQLEERLKLKEEQLEEAQQNLLLSREDLESLLKKQENAPRQCGGVEVPRGFSEAAETDIGHEYVMRISRLEKELEKTRKEHRQDILSKTNEMAKVRELSDQLKIAKVENSQLRKRLTSLQGVAAGEVEGAAGPIPTPPAMTSVLGSIRKQLTDSSVTGSTMPHASKKRLWREAGEIVTAPGRKEEGSTLRPRADLAAPSPPKRLHIQKPTATSVALENSENSGPDNCAATTTVDGNCDGGDKAPRVAGSVARSRNRFAESRQRRRNREQQEAGDEGTNQQQQQQCAMQ